MQDNPLPWFRFFPRDWLAETREDGFNAAACGCLMLMLCACWGRGSVPRDRHALAVLCQHEGPELDQAAAKLIPLGSDTSRLYSPKIEIERERASLKYHQAQNAAKKRWSKKHPRKSLTINE